MFKEMIINQMQTALQNEDELYEKLQETYINKNIKERLSHNIKFTNFVPLRSVNIPINNVMYIRGRFNRAVILSDKSFLQTVFLNPVNEELTDALDVPSMGFIESIIREYQSIRNHDERKVPALTLYKLRNPYFSYLIAFASSFFSRKNYVFSMKERQKALIINELSSLPCLNENLKQKIMLDIVKNIGKIKVTRTMASYDYAALNTFKAIERLNFRRQIMARDLYYRKEIAVGRYIVPCMLKRVKLSLENIEEMVVYLRENLVQEILNSNFVDENTKSYFGFRTPLLQEGNLITSFSGIAFEGLPV